MLDQGTQILWIDFDFQEDLVVKPTSNPENI
jgi:hypothetical protein